MDREKGIEESGKKSERFIGKQFIYDQKEQECDEAVKDDIGHMKTLTSRAEKYFIEREGKHGEWSIES